MSIFFFFNDTATTEIYTLSLHDALPIYLVFARIGHRIPLIQHLFEGEPTLLMKDGKVVEKAVRDENVDLDDLPVLHEEGDRKSTRLNSSHVRISYAVFCLKKKNTKYRMT